MSETWENATQTLTAHPAKILSATSEQDLVEFVKDALANKKRIRPAGGGHSWYPLVLTDDSVEPQVIELGGFIAAGYHGTGWQEPTIPDLVHAITHYCLVDDRCKR